MRYPSRSDRSQILPVFIFVLLLLPALISQIPRAAAQQSTANNSNSLPGVFKDPGIPAELDAWRDWASYTQADDRCPRQWENRLEYGDRVENGVMPAEYKLYVSAICAWPGELALDARADGAYFTANWRLYQAGAIPLPGDGANWPIDVRSETQALVVNTDHYGRPVVFLEPGEYRISGRIPWQQRPESLAVPKTAQLRLRRDGELISPIDFDNNGELWLGAPLREKEQNKVYVSVARLVNDGLPETMTSVIELDVSGEPREIVLGPALLPGHALLSIKSELPARMDNDGRLNIQARSGYWELSLESRAPINHDGYTVLELDAPWPAEEYWGVAPNYGYRSIHVSGGQLIDSSQTSLPAAFHNQGLDKYPLRVLRAGEKLELIELQRGQQVSPDQIQVEREAWLNFDGQTLRYTDHLTGTINQTTRLNAQTPFILDLAEITQFSYQQKTLITYDPKDTAAPEQLTGVEWRLEEVEMTTQMHAPFQASLPLTAWDQALEELSLTLNLPPGYQLIHVSGFDHAHSSWIERWNLLSIFLSILCAVLLWHVGRWKLFIPGALLVVLMHQQPAAPLFGLLALSSVLLLMRWNNSTKGHMWLRRLFNLSWIILGLQLLWFSGVQLQSTIYPALEPEPDYDEYSFGLQKQAVSISSDSPTEAYDKDSAELDRVEISGSRFAYTDILTPYDPNAHRQAGLGQAQWRWHQHTMQRQGPITANEQLRLLISPPWLTRLLRLVMVCAAFILVWGLAKASGHQPTDTSATPTARTAKPTAQLASILLSLGFVLGVLLLPSTSLKAQTIPTPELLQELATRLQPPPACLPYCVNIAKMHLQADDHELRFEADVHSAIFGVAKLPTLEDLNQQLNISVQMDGTTIAMDAQHQIAVSPGRHAVLMIIQNPGLSEWKLNFGMPPKHLSTELDGWEISGLQGDRLQSQGIALYRSINTNASTTTLNTLNIQPYITVSRMFFLDLQPYVENSIARLDSGKGTAQFHLPLMDGEEYVGPSGDETVSVEFKDGVQTFSLTHDSDFYWRNNLARQTHFEFTASTQENLSEEWTFITAAVLDAKFSGAQVQIGPSDIDDYLVHRIKPRPGETVIVDLQRPAPVAGSSQAFDMVHLTMQPGRHYADYHLQLKPNLSQPGLFPFQLPQGAELRHLAIDEDQPPLPAVNGTVNIPVNQETEQITIEWRQSLPSQASLSTPELQLDRPSANLITQVEWAGDRWLLWTSGPGMGPAVRFWSLLLLLVVTALVLARLPHSPLPTHHWLLLGLGFSTVNSWAFLWIVAFFFLLAWRQRLDLPQLRPWQTVVVQLGLALLALISVMVLIGTIMDGLLARPDMSVANPLPLYASGISHYGALSWFIDTSNGTLPSVQVYSAPMWLYRGVMLAWSLWLALHCVRWLRWGWQAYSHGGLWYQRRAKTRPAEAAEHASDTVE